MSSLLDWSWSLDGWIVLAGILCATSAALLGNFLVLRKLSLLGDAISHAVLPGLAVAFLWSGSRSSPAMFLGAAAVGLLTAVLTEWVREQGRVDEGASLGVVFTTFFAVGLVLMVQAADHVDLDPSCVLHGSIEFTPLDRVPLLGIQLPRVIPMLGGVFMINALFVWLCFKELTISAFDAELATSQGYSAKWMHYLLMSLVAVTATASFECVGSILVVAMFVVPPATAYVCTDRLPRMILLSLLFAVLAATLGHLAAIQIPRWFGFRSTTTGAMMAVMSGVLFVAAWLFAPRHGVVMQWFLRRQLALKIMSEDLLAWLYKNSERFEPRPATQPVISNELGARGWSVGLLGWWLRQRGLLRDEGGVWVLTPQGSQAARTIVRSHRLWESYLVHEAGTDLGRIHDMAEQLEHFTDLELRQRLDEETATQEHDPHGSPIPPE